MSFGDIHIFILRHIQGVVMAISVIILTELISKKYNKFSYWGSKTLGIYLIHVFIVDYVVNKNGWTVSSTGYVIVDVCVALLIALILSMLTILICKLLSKTHISRMLVLGEK